MITIQVNKNKRRVLTFDTFFDLESNVNFPENMFDAVFITSTSVNEVKTILGKINPVISNKCCYKPLLVYKSLEGCMDEYAELIDGYVANDINDENILQKVDDLIRYREQIGLQRSGTPLTSANLFFIRLCRYLITRKRHRLVPIPMEGSSMGYVVPVFDLFYKLGHYQLNEYILFLQSMLEKGYFRTERFLNKIYLCPQCLHSHLLYIESCPRCGSSSIKSEEVIHHFRCANISPEHTYNFGGQLRCPKCHQLLRHIGVDYDRPSTVYTCSSCENHFLQPGMKILCTSCKETADVNRLIAQDISVFELTQEGRKALLSPNVGFTVYTDFYDNYLEYDRFTNRLRLLIGQKNMNRHTSGVSVERVWILNISNETTLLRTDMIAFFCEKFPNNKVSSANNMIYIKETDYDMSEEGRAEFLARLQRTMKEASLHMQPGDTICHSRIGLDSNESTAMKTFFDNLNLVSQEPDGQYAFEGSTLEGTPMPIEADTVYAGPDEPDEPATAVADDEETVVSSYKAKRGRSRWPIVVSVLVALAVVAAGLLWLLRRDGGQAAAEDQAVDTESVQSPIPDEAEMPADPDATATAAEELPEATYSDDMAHIKPVVAGRNYVVAGVYRSDENLSQDIKRLMDKDASLQCSIYSKGERFIISIYDSDDRESCERFMNEHVGRLPDLWVLKAQ